MSDLSSSATWLDDAAQMPVYFAQVREDPLVDRWVIEHGAANRDALHIIQIASGGCTAAVLASMPQVACIHLVDPNPAQIALTRMKLHCMRQYDQGERARLFGHEFLSKDDRANRIGNIFDDLDLAHDVLGPPALVAELGADYIGRYELLFTELQRSLAHCSTMIDAMLSLTDVAEQQRCSAPGTPLGDVFDKALRSVMALDHLVRLFGTGATGNAAQEFHQHFAERLHRVLATLPAATNPWLWQLLRGRNPPSHPVDWLQLPRQSFQAHVTWRCAMMDAALSEHHNDADVVHLSNILDWLSVDDAQRTLELAWRALRPGGMVVIRQLNSTLDIPALGSAFAWDTHNSKRLHQQDRSFFYRDLHLGRRT